MRDNDNGEFYPEPPTAECRRCGEVDFEDGFDEDGNCPHCQAKLWAQRKLSGVVFGGKV